MRASAILLALLAIRSAALAADVPCASPCRAAVAACRRTACRSVRGPAKVACEERCEKRADCPARTRTMAYVVTRCHLQDGMVAGGQELRLQAGDCAPTTVLRLDIQGVVPDPAGLCAILAGN